MLIGLRIKEARIAKNMTQQQVADIVGVSKTSVCLYERNMKNPTLKNFQRLSDALDVSPEYLMGIDMKIMESEDKIAVNVSKQDLVIISELKKYEKLYENLYTDPVRTIKLIDKKLKDRLY